MFTNTVEFLQKAIVFHPGETHFLALKRAETDPVRPSTWDSPGGNVDYGERHDHAILREIREETGLEVSHLSVAQVVTHYEPNHPYWLFIGHTCRALHKEVTLSSEHSAFRWLRARDFLALPSAPFLKNFVAHAFA